MPGAAAASAHADANRSTTTAPSWSLQKSYAPSLGSVNDVSCRGTACVVVGQSGPPSAGPFAAVAFSHAGTAWQTGTLPPNIRNLMAVSCATASDCWAVGVSVAKAATIVLTTDGGSSWTAETIPAGNKLSSLSCPTTSDCLAVGTTAVATSDGGPAGTTRRCRQGPPP